MNRFTQRLQIGAPVPMRCVIQEPHIMAGLYWVTPKQLPCPMSPCVPVGALRANTREAEANFFRGNRCVATLTAARWKASGVQRRVNRIMEGE